MRANLGYHTHTHCVSVVFACPPRCSCPTRTGSADADGAKKFTGCEPWRAALRSRRREWRLSVVNGRVIRPSYATVAPGPSLFCMPSSPSVLCFPNACLAPCRLLYYQRFKAKSEAQRGTCAHMPAFFFGCLFLVATCPWMTSSNRDFVTASEWAGTGHAREAQ